MQHSNYYSNVKNIDHSIIRLNTWLFNDKIGSRLQIAFFVLFNQIFQLPPLAYLTLPNVPIPPNIRTLRLF